ncbi:uncharacterized protein LOC108742900 [Agrilus planipennis]|uniref:Uncharacterized protein LOC108742900 n=1 Tax=Agrilus planipennis TaxID=224129 RepID=A0A1W4XCA6_AGRPL|nr:uncharacterized protein LOC108742900 [Agrilus planipennis]
MWSTWSVIVYFYMFVIVIIYNSEQVKSITNVVEKGRAHKNDSTQNGLVILTNEVNNGDDQQKSSSETKKRSLFSDSKRNHHIFNPSGGGDYAYIPPSSDGYYHRPPVDYGPDYHKEYLSPYEEKYPIVPYIPDHKSYGGYNSYSHLLNSPYTYKTLLALKGFLIPLAGVALLGAAAALTTHPVLLQLGSINKGRRRRRRRRSLP